VQPWRFLLAVLRSEKSFSLRVPRKIVIAFGRDQDPLGGVLLFISDPGDITNDLVGRRVIRKVIKGGGELHFPPGIGRCHYHQTNKRSERDPSRRHPPLCLAQDKLCAITDQQRSEKMTFSGSRRSCAALCCLICTWQVTRAPQKYYENGAKARMENNKYKQTRYKEYVKFIINSHSAAKFSRMRPTSFFVIQTTYVKFCYFYLRKMGWESGNKFSQRMATLSMEKLRAKKTVKGKGKNSSR
jgi:hypothetical protein